VNAGIQVDLPGNLIEHIQDHIPEVCPMRPGHDKTRARWSKRLVDDAQRNVLLFHVTLLWPL
jgi:hypothetical protein